MQRCVAFGVGDGRAGAVGQQREYRLGPAVAAVAGGGQQRRQPAGGAIDVGTAGDQRAQQARVRQQRRQHQHGTLVAIGGIGRGIRIGTGLDQRQRPLDVAVAGRRQQGLGLLGRAGDALLFVQRHRCRARWIFHIVRQQRLLATLAAACAQQGAQGAVGHHQTAQRQHHHAVDGQCGDAQFRGQHAVQTGERDGHERHHQQRKGRRQEVAEKAFLAGQVATERQAAQGGGENPRAIALLRVGVIPYENQPERRPQPPQHRQRNHAGGRQRQRGAEPV